VDIWSKHNIFPSQCITKLESKLNGSATSQAGPSTTPPYDPPAWLTSGKGKGKARFDAGELVEDAEKIKGEGKSLFSLFFSVSWAACGVRTINGECQSPLPPNSLVKTPLTGIFVEARTTIWFAPQLLTAPASRGSMALVERRLFKWHASHIPALFDIDRTKELSWKFPACS